VGKRTYSGSPAACVGRALRNLIGFQTRHLENMSEDIQPMVPSNLGKFTAERRYIASGSAR
jgi:hypothetical protein